MALFYLYRGTNSNPIEFHIKENLPGAYIGRLLYKNGRKNIETSSEIKDLIGYSTKNEDIRQNRHLNSKFQRNATNNPALSFIGSSKRKIRDINSNQNFTAITQVTSSTIFEELTQPSNSILSYTLPHITKRPSTWRPKTIASKNTEIEKEHHITPTSLYSQRHVQRSSTIAPVNSSYNSKDSTSLRRLKSDKPVGLRFIIANQQDVTNKITIMDDGTLMTLNGLDRETHDIYRLTIIAEYSKGFISGAGIYQINVYVDDVNDNPPVFESTSYSAMINENSPLGTELFLNRIIQVSDADAGKNAEFTVSLAGEGSHLFAIEFVNRTSNTFNSSYPIFDSQEKFDIEKNFISMQFGLFNSNNSYINGPYYVLKFYGNTPLDRERESLYHLRLVAKDTGGLSSSVKLTILVADVNDNAPIFKKIAVFKDAGVEIVEYSNDLEIYFVEKMNDNINRNIDIIDKQFLIATEYIMSGSPRLSNITQNRNLRVRKGRSRMRQVKKSKTPPLFSVMEDIPIGTSVLKITAIDDDSNKNAHIFYEIISETIHPDTFIYLKSKLVPFFNIDRISGEIKINHPLQANLEIILNITARDPGDLFDITEIHFKVIDVNNHAPEFKKSWYSLDLQEGIYYDQSIERIEAIDEDYGSNANITYRIESTNDYLPFRISTRTGVLKVDGDIDRELKSQYDFLIFANDNAENGQKLTSSVEIEINVLDVNDNAPEFIGFDDIIITQKNELEETGRKLITEENLNKIQFLDKIPVYKAYLNRNTIPGTFVKQITAVDKDYAGNGNGLVMFSLLHHRLPYLFEIDSRDGIITSISRLNRYNGYEHVNLTVVASDLGSPSKSSTALLSINLQGDEIFDEDEMNLFPHKYYEVQINENNLIPLELLKINISSMYSKDTFNWQIIPETDEAGYESFVIDPRNGTLYVITSLDREKKDTYRLKVRADRIGRESKAMPTLTYPVGGERIQGLQENEVRVVVHVNDLNDNSPKFKGNGRPIVTVIPNTANFGFPVTQVEATDADIGINAEIRYKLLNEPSRLFAIDGQNGKIRVLGPINGEQRVYGFDVKATDRKGGDDGRSSIANVFVYVLDESRQVRLVISGKPVEVEREVDILMKNLSEVTGMDVRIRLLEPHFGELDSA